MNAAAALPKVPTIDGPPAPNAPAIVESARAAVAPARRVIAPHAKKPSGAWYRKAREARARGEAPPPWPPVSTPAAPFVASEAAPPAPPEPEPPAPQPEPAAPPASPALTSVLDADAEAQRAERAREAAALADESRRVAMTTGPGLERLERRAAQASKAAFAIVGLLLGDEHGVWPLSDVQAQSIAELLCEAWPEEMAELMAEGGLTKMLAISTIAQIVREKWRRHKAAKAGELPPPGDPVRVVEAPAAASSTAAPPQKFVGLPDMARAG